MMATRGRIILMAGRTARPEMPVGPFYIKDLRLLGMTLFNATPDEQRAMPRRFGALAERGGWHPQIGKTLPLCEAAAAHRLQEENTSAQKGFVDWQNRLNDCVNRRPISSCVLSVSHMSIRIPFNKPFIAGKELYYIAQAVTLNNLAGDGHFTRQCCHLLEQAFGIHRVLLTPLARPPSRWRPSSAT